MYYIHQNTTKIRIYEIYIGNPEIYETMTTLLVQVRNFYYLL